MSHNMLRKALRQHRELRNQVEALLIGDDGNEYEAELRKFVCRRPCWVKGGDVVPVAPPLVTYYLDLVSTKANLYVGPTTGEETFSAATDLFTAGIDRNFKGWGCDKKTKSTPEIPVYFYKQIRRAMLAHICIDFSVFFTPGQVLNFVRYNKNQLKPQGLTSFPFEVDGLRLVATVGLSLEDELCLSVHSLHSGVMWSVDPLRRWVLPQLAL